MDYCQNPPPRSTTSPATPCIYTSYKTLCHLPRLWIKRRLQRLRRLHFGTVSGRWTQFPKKNSRFAAVRTTFTPGVYRAFLSLSRIAALRPPRRSKNAKWDPKPTGDRIIERKPKTAAVFRRGTVAHAGTSAVLSSSASTPHARRSLAAQLSKSISSRLSTAPVVPGQAISDPECVASRDASERRVESRRRYGWPPIDRHPR
jgi:hypothetical protein